MGEWLPHVPAIQDSDKEFLTPWIVSLSNSWMGRHMVGFTCSFLYWNFIEISDEISSSFLGDEISYGLDHFFETLRFFCVINELKRKCDHSNGSGKEGGSEFEIKICLRHPAPARQFQAKVQAKVQAGIIGNPLCGPATVEIMKCHDI